MLKTDRIPKHIANALYPREDYEVTPTTSGPITLNQDAIPVLKEAADKFAEMDRAEFRIPDVIFGDFQDAPELARLARDLADEYEGNPRVSDVLWHSEGAEIRYAWKAQGGKSGGRAVLGKCVKLSGPARHFSGNADYLIWVAWDHAKNLRLGRQELMALLFHELHHIQRDVTDDGEDVYGTRGHELETFFAEIAVFGAWRSDMKRGQKAFGQIGLPGVD